MCFYVWYMYIYVVYVWHVYICVVYVWYVYICVVYVWHVYIYVVYEGFSFPKDQSPLYPSSLFVRHHFRVVPEVKEGQGVKDRESAPSAHRGRGETSCLSEFHTDHCGHFDMHTLDIVTSSS